MKNKQYEIAYHRAKNKESFYELNESNLRIFEAAECFINPRVLDPEKVTYEQIMNGIETLCTEKETAKLTCRSRSYSLSCLPRSTLNSVNFVPINSSSLRASDFEHPNSKSKSKFL